VQPLLQFHSSIDFGQDFLRFIALDPIYALCDFSFDRFVKWKSGAPRGLNTLFPPSAVFVAHKLHVCKVHHLRNIASAHRLIPHAAQRIRLQRLHKLCSGSYLIAAPALGGYAPDAIEIGRSFRVNYFPRPWQRIVEGIVTNGY